MLGTSANPDKHCHGNFVYRAFVSTAPNTGGFRSIEKEILTGLTSYSFSSQQRVFTCTSWLNFFSVARTCLTMGPCYCQLVGIFETHPSLISLSRLFHTRCVLQHLDDANGEKF
jgi:hypothetical protein